MLQLIGFHLEQLDVAIDQRGGRAQLVRRDDHEVLLHLVHAAQFGIGVLQIGDGRFQPGAERVAIFFQPLHLHPGVDVFPRARQELLDLAGQGVDIDRFGDVPVAAGDQRNFPIGLQGIGRHGDHGRVLGFLHFFQARGHFVPRHAAHVDVGQDQGRANLPGQFQTGQAVFGDVDFIAFRLQDALHQAAAVGVVFDV